METNADIRSANMRVQATAIEQTLVKKLSSTTFYRIMTTLIAIVIAAIGANWGVMMSIENKMDSMAINQAVIAKHLEIDLPRR